MMKKHKQWNVLEIFWISDSIFLANQVKNNQIVNQATDSINKIRNAVIRKKIPENKNPNEIIDIVEKILNFNN